MIWFISWIVVATSAVSIFYKKKENLYLKDKLQKQAIVLQACNKIWLNYYLKNMNSYSFSLLFQWCYKN